MSSTLRRWNIAAGQFFFRYRNGLFPTVFLLITLTLRPSILFHHPTLDKILVLCGVFVAIGGEAFRLATIGLEYIERGGKNGRAYASRLVQKGMYGHTRNPMYVGNSLIAIGMSMATGAPVAYLIVIPFFLFVYQAIVASEEEYLRTRFGDDYSEYCTRVPRFIPSFRNVSPLSDIRYHWKRALRQDLSTLAALLLGLGLLPLWRAYFLRGEAVAKEIVPQTAILTAGVLIFYGVVHSLKKRGRLAD